MGALDGSFSHLTFRGDYFYTQIHNMKASENYIYVELTKGQKLKIHFILFSHVYLTPKKTLFINLSSYPTFPKTVILGTPSSPRLVLVSFKAPVSVQGVIKIFEFNRNRFQNKLNEKLNAVVRS